MTPKILGSTSTAPPEPLTPHDICDASCSTKAHSRVTFKQGDLLFCAPHLRDNENIIREQALEIYNVWGQHFSLGRK